VLLAPRYRKDVDGLRGLAVLLVVAYHAFPYDLRGGYFGVDIFFVISGYVVTNLLLINLHNRTKLLRAFYFARARKLLPPLVIISIGTITLGFILSPSSELFELGKQSIFGLFFLSNFYFESQTGYFDTSSFEKPFLHTWSLGVEAQFYLLWPLLITLLFRGNRPRQFTIATLVLITLLSFFYCLDLQDIAPSQSFYSPLARLWELSIGGLLAYLHFTKSTSRNGIQRKSLLMTIFGFWLILACLVIPKFNHPGLVTMLPVAGTILLIHYGERSKFSQILLGNKAVVRVGKLSYSLYLWHFPLLAFARLIDVDEPSPVLRLQLVFLAILLSYFTYTLVEKPMRSVMLSRQGIIRITRQVLMGMVVVGYVLLTSGVPSRAWQNDLEMVKAETKRLPESNDNCLDLFKNLQISMDFCLFSKVGASKTVAIIGDSHAHAAYTGFEELLEEKGRNTLLLANKGCPPLLELPIVSTRIHLEKCIQSTSQILEFVLGLPTVETIYFIARGTVYTRPPFYNPFSENTSFSQTISLKEYREALQQTVNLLSSAGKSVVVVSEHPELQYTAKDCIKRPFRTNIPNCKLSRIEFLKSHRPYIYEMEQLINASFVDTTDLFCPSNNCEFVSREGRLLYSDSHHLSPSGSRYLAAYLLKNSIT
jgi:peptidoglycan/LPS O-acetylase OafA/YrhL